MPVGNMPVRYAVRHRTHGRAITISLINDNT